MHCVLCGAANPTYGKFCHNCGEPLFRPTSSETADIAPRIPDEQKHLIELLNIDPKPNQCHRCGTETELQRSQFAMAKVVSVKRDFSDTIVGVGLSAVSIAFLPLTGHGMLRWKGPDKTTSFKLIKAELVLCPSCFAWARQGTPLLGRVKIRTEAYRCHPWAEKAGEMGYDRFLSAEELTKLKPVQKKG